MVVGIVLVSAHQADRAHATLTDGSVVHVDDAGSVIADVHVACQEHSRTSTVDRHTPPVAGAERCWIGDVAPTGVTAHDRCDHVDAAIARPALAVPSARPPATLAVLDLAPKTSPPV